MERVRVIPTLLIENNHLVKSIKFKNHRYIGDPINAIKIFNEKEVDELVVIDILASKKNRKPNFKLIKEIASECFMPLSYGGGISSFEEAQQLFKSGVEKLILNTSSFKTPLLIEQITKAYGNQSVVISIDVKKDLLGNYYVYSHSGSVKSKINPISFAIEMQRLGAGEIILNSVDKDGTYSGYDYELIRRVSIAVTIPVIALGGAGSLSDIEKAIKSGASAVAAGSLFSFYGKLKAVLINYPSQEELEKYCNVSEFSKSRELKILHITAWYPNKYNTHRALFIRENFNAIDLFANNFLKHIDINLAEKKFSVETFFQSKKERTIIFRFPFKIWYLVELLSSFILIYYLLKNKNFKKFDVLNFHIAYPFGVYLKFLNLFFKKPIVISEHWTAYHYHFYINKQKRGLRRIKKIFKSETPIIVVSEALANDIKKFSGNKSLKYHVLFNIVDSAIFNSSKPDYPKIPTFLMVNMWSKIKQPYMGIDAFEKLLLKYPDAKLKIGGFGPLWKEIKKYVQSKNIENSVVLLGKLNKYQIAEELNSSSALLHTSKYETFSVISAEAISCGVPVIAINEGGIPSFVNETNGYLHNENTVDGWVKGMEYIIEHQQKFNKTEIGLKANKLFSKDVIGKKYYSILKQEYREFYSKKKEPC